MCADSLEWFLIQLKPQTNDYATIIIHIRNITLGNRNNYTIKTKSTLRNAEKKKFWNSPVLLLSFCEENIYFLILFSR